MEPMTREDGERIFSMLTILATALMLFDAEMETDTETALATLGAAGKAMLTNLPQRLKDEMIQGLSRSQ